MLASLLRRSIKQLRQKTLDPDIHMDATPTPNTPADQAHSMRSEDTLEIDKGCACGVQHQGVPSEFSLSPLGCEVGLGHSPAHVL